MESLRELFSIGIGPSSSHTMGPRKAALKFLEKNKNAHSFRVTLYGSLSATGKGHLTNSAIVDALKPLNTQIIWSDKSLDQHPNGMLFEALDAEELVIDSKIYFSPGGGAVISEGEKKASKQIYPLTTMHDILIWSKDSGNPLWKYVEIYEGEGIWDYLMQIWQVMQNAIERGIRAEGILPGILKLERRSRSYYLKSRWCATHLKRTGLLAAYALAVSEENAAGGEIVTAPTCGASGVLPAVLYYMKNLLALNDEDIIHGLAIAGLIGNLTKFNATISGAEAGCQAEVGTACAMAAAAATQLMGGTNQQIECAAEMGMEHHLGLTCDPISGLVQIPCIERNSIAATRALDCADMAVLSDGAHRVTFDEVVETMYQTGKDMSVSYRETSLGGLARLNKDR